MRTTEDMATELGVTVSRINMLVRVGLPTVILGPRRRVWDDATYEAALEWHKKYQELLVKYAKRPGPDKLKTFAEYAKECDFHYVDVRKKKREHYRENYTKYYANRKKAKKP